MTRNDTCPFTALPICLLLSRRILWCCTLLAVSWLLAGSPLLTTVAFGGDHQPSPWQQCICAAEPELHWDFSSSDFASVCGTLQPALIRGQPRVEPTGPAAPEFPLFGSSNPAVRFDGSSYLAFDDPGSQSLLDYGAGDAISIEVWVRMEAIAEGQQVYIVGKGRTQNPGQAKDNQNYALRMRGIGGMAHVSFLYRSADRPAEVDADGGVIQEAYKGEFHRWNSQAGVEPDGHWHHVAVSHTFGSSRTPRVWIDGQPCGGSWDMGAATFMNPPHVDDDQLWIGSSMGGSRQASFRGAIDELAIFRRELTDREIQERFRTNRTTSTIVELSEVELPEDHVVFDIREAVNAADPWERQGTRLTMQWQQPAAAVAAVPRKYLSGGIIGDRTNPSLLRMRCRIRTEEQTVQFLIRSRSHARLLIDGQQIVSLNQAKRAADGHEEVPEPVAPLYPHMHPLPAGDQEAVTEFRLPAGDHLIEMETVIGGPGMRVEHSETMIAVGSADEGFHLMTPQLLSPESATERIGMDERSWRRFADHQRQHIAEIEQQERERQSAVANEWWKQRHQLARRMIGLAPESAVIDSDGVDRMLLHTLSVQQLQPMPVVDDLTFLRRLALNTVGVIPTTGEIAWFLDQPQAVRREKAVDRYLADRRWADHWVAYWQDVLAENPGILKPELNNSGPFRWWIHEAFLDNRPSDRFATELVMMRGSRLGGGPAGFAMATQNDVPLAERALVLATAFNAREMKCARCHDSPTSSITQQQLFELAAMINRGPLKLPATSTVPPGPNGERSALISVSLEPGAVIAPRWPFDIDRGTHTDEAAQLSLTDELTARGLADAGVADDWAALLQNPADTREQAALHLTHPVESRFAHVLVNRLWARYFGSGLLPFVDHWDDDPTLHSDLLQALAEQHIHSGYDIRSTAAVILKTNAFQREVAAPDASVTQLFGAQSLRRMTAEQLVDSLYAAAGKQFDAEMLTLDQEGRRPESSFLNLGQPTRAWHFCGLSNERDRPALALPVAQSIFDLLTVFGWREARPFSRTERDEEATVLQSLTLANGTAGRRLIQLSDGAAATELAIRAESPEALTEQLFLRLLTRTPGPAEQVAFAAELSVGFEERIIAGATLREQPVVHRNPVSWSNHLHPRATEIKQQLEAAARSGDPATSRLRTEWRLIAEDVVWVLLNSPEFAFVP